MSSVNKKKVKSPGKSMRSFYNKREVNSEKKIIFKKFYYIIIIIII